MDKFEKKEDQKKAKEIADNFLKKYFSEGEKAAPTDILKLPKEYRPVVLERYKEKISERYLNLAKFRFDIFNYIEVGHKNLSLNINSLYEEIDRLLIFYDLDSKSIRGIIQYQLIAFWGAYEKIFENINLSREELVKKFINNDANLKYIDLDTIETSITPYSIDFFFLDTNTSSEEKDLKNFFFFTTNLIEENAQQKYQQDKKKNTELFGLCYKIDGVNITAGKNWNRDNYLKNTFVHEQQHKKFNFFSKDYLKRTTYSPKDEILARVASNDSTSSIRIALLGYHDISRANYQEFIEDFSTKEISQYIEDVTSAIDVIDHFKNMDFGVEKIIGILSREDIERWSKIKKHFFSKKLRK